MNLDISVLLSAVQVTIIVMYSTIINQMYTNIVRCTINVM